MTMYDLIMRRLNFFSAIRVLLPEPEIGIPTCGQQDYDKSAVHHHCKYNHIYLEYINYNLECYNLNNIHYYNCSTDYYYKHIYYNS